MLKKGGAREEYEDIFNFPRNCSIINIPNLETQEESATGPGTGAEEDPDLHLINILNINNSPKEEPEEEPGAEEEPEKMKINIIKKNSTDVTINKNVNN